VGIPLFADHVPARDERMVAAVRQAGAIVVGKTNVPEWGAGANTKNPVYGATGNPFDPKRICGGSSGGSAVALATSMLPICTGSDTGGSLRIPAAFCGIVGFRPSPGLVPSERRPLGWTPISVQGPMGRTVEDTLLLLQAQISEDSRDPLARARRSPQVRDALADRSLGVAGRRLGGSRLHAARQRIRATFEERVDLLQSVFKSCERRDPDMADADEAFAIIRACNFLAAHRERYEKHRDKLGPNIVANVEQGLKMSLADVARGHAMQTRIYRVFQEFFRDVDILISPTVSVPPFPLEQLYVKEIDGVALPTYFTWLGADLCAHLDRSPLHLHSLRPRAHRHAFALQICGPARSDKFILDVAHAIERQLARDKRTSRPLPDLENLAR